ncbi:MAG: hypothetical protein AAGK92_07105 [Pseudomonadota bacterium]
MKSTLIAIASTVMLLLAPMVKAQTLIGPKVDESFAVHGFAEVMTKSGETGFLSVVYFKKFKYKNKIAICGAYTGSVFDSRNNKLFLRGGRIGSKFALVTNLTYLQRLEDFSQQQTRGKAVPGGELFEATLRYGKGLPTRCKVSNKTWSPEYTEPDLWIRIPTTRTVMRKG